MQKLLLFDTHNETESYTYVHFACVLNFMWVCEKIWFAFRIIFFSNLKSIHILPMLQSFPHSTSGRRCAERDAFNLCIKIRYASHRIPNGGFYICFLFYFISLFVLAKGTETARRAQIYHNLTGVPNLQKREYVHVCMRSCMCCAGACSLCVCLRCRYCQSE